MFMLTNMRIAVFVTEYIVYNVQRTAGLQNIM